ncbi:hypothetical protein [Pontibacter kalidii]|uniref:hypothetical protein n=1 Tax=Pontibacter kalidii TaxID=2592049 RepID=UPI0022589E34|nr:hypothetical protein [Pontibacter kalidii]
MNLNLFNTHTLAGRLEIIWAHGNFIAYRGRRGYRIELYNLGSFFAEVWYNPENDYISLVRGFTSNKALEPYITQVDLMEMLDW